MAQKSQPKYHNSAGGKLRGSNPTTMKDLPETLPITTLDQSRCAEKQEALHLRNTT